MFAAPLALTDGADAYTVAPADIQAAIGFGTGRMTSTGSSSTASR